MIQIALKDITIEEMPSKTQYVYNPWQINTCKDENTKARIKLH